MNKNEMYISFDARSVNEGFARVAVAAFLTEADPTLDEIADIKTAVSEAVTNAIIHGYERPEEKVERTVFHHQASAGAFRHGIFLYGSVYGPSGGDLVGRKWNNGDYEEKNRSVGA